MANKKKGRSGKKAPGFLKRLIIALIGAVVLSVSLYAAFSLPVLAPGESESGALPVAAEGELRFFTLDVGQGDCLFLISPLGNTMMIDAGESDAYPAIEEFMEEQQLSDIDVVVATHPHADHIGGMAEVIRNYEIGQIYMPDRDTGTKTLENLLDAIAQEQIPSEALETGDEIAWDDAVDVDVLSPLTPGSYDEINDESIVLRVEYGGTSFLLTGDAETFIEREMMENASDLTADVLKVGHHGSKTSSHLEFLQAVNPEYAVISSGAGNSYNHPSTEIVERLEQQGIDVLRTDTLGTIAFTSDGANVQFIQ